MDPSSPPERLTMLQQRSVECLRTVDSAHRDLNARGRRVLRDLLASQLVRLAADDGELDNWLGEGA